MGYAKLPYLWLPKSPSPLTNRCCASSIGSSKTASSPAAVAAISAAVLCLKEQRQRKQRLLAELSKLDPVEERELAEERMQADMEWPAF